MALNPYSVSPRRRDHRVGPKPIMYWPTRTPNFLAGHEVAELVEGDRRGEPHDQEHDTDDERDHFHTHTVPACGFELAVTCDRGAPARRVRIGRRAG